MLQESHYYYGQKSTVLIETKCRSTFDKNLAKLLRTIMVININLWKKSSLLTDKICQNTFDNHFVEVLGTTMDPACNKMLQRAGHD